VIRGVPALVALTLAVLVALALPARAALPQRMPDGEVPTLAPVMERVTPTVVNIATFTTVEVRNPLFADPFFRRFFDSPLNQRRYRRTRSAGSGVIVDAERGHIVTNEHVIRRADEIAVTLADGRTVAAELVGSDAQVDLAVLRLVPDADADLDLASLAEAEFGDSARLRVGDFVVAVGNPFGLGQTVTSGIVSAIGRSGLGIEGYEDFIQTDASINPGNSGGALVDLNGRLVGINTAILAPSGGNVGIGFAIPADMVRAILDALVADGEVRRGHLGLAVQEMNVELARAFGIDDRDGVVVTAVEADSPAAAAGLAVGDVLVRLGDRRVRSIVDYRARAAVVLVGDAFEVEFVRGGERRTTRLTVPEDAFERLDGARLHPGLAGATLQNHRDGDDGEGAAGVALLEVARGSIAWRTGLRAEDVVVAANGRPATNLSELAAGIKLRANRTVVRIRRAGSYYDVRLAR
jgi:serine protease Do/serine protease DegQ